MPTQILVAYATRYGSTQEVAEDVAKTLREQGLTVDIQPIRQVQTLGQYQAIVLGAPLYMFHWHKDARHFLSRHSQELTQLPVAIFAVGPLHVEEKEWQGAQAQLDAELAKFPWLTPIALELFGGKFDPEKLRFPEALVNAMPASPLKNMPASDIRDWVAIRAWATDLASKLAPSRLPA